MTDYKLTENEFTVATGLAEKTFRPYRERYQRLSVARAKMVELATLGVVRTAYRLKTSTKLRRISPAVWSVLRVHHVFVLCKFDPHRPDSNGVDGDRYADIFVERASLASCIASMSESAEPVEPPTSAGSPNSERGASGNAAATVRLSSSEKAGIFSDWRSRVPDATLKEDFAEMAKFGISQHDVKLLRRDTKNRGRGENKHRPGR